MTHIRKLGGGYFGYTDLYKDKAGNYYVIKTQKVLESDLVLTKGKYKFKQDCSFKDELMFFAWVSKLPAKHSKYFMQQLKLNDYITKGGDFDYSRLGSCRENKNCIELRKSEFIYKSKLTFAGEVLGDYLERFINQYFNSGAEISAITELPNTEVIPKIIADIQTIIKLANEAGFFINDLHIGNLCWNGENVVLIDYGNIKIVKLITDNYILRKWNMKHDIINLLYILLNLGIIYNLCSKYYEFKHPILNIKCLQKLKHWVQIKSYLRAIYKNTDLGTLDRQLNDIDNNIYVLEDVRDIVDIADTIAWVLDCDEYMQIWSSEEMFPITKGVSIDIPYLIPQKQIIDILDTYLTKKIN